MPRQARKKSESGIYHVMLRGINRQVIFEEEEDYNKFLFILSDCKKISRYEVLAYCILENHVHILLKTSIEDPDKIFKRIGVRYVYWYNSKYDRTGHLFQDRYRSKPVEDDRYFLTVLKYILQNPVKAKLCEKAEKYRWSSCADYLTGKGITDTAFALRLFGEEPSEAMKAFYRWLLDNNDDTDNSASFKNGRLSERDAKNLILQICGTMDPAALQQIEHKKRDRIILQLRENGLSIRQIVRLTGIGFGIVRKV